MRASERSTARCRAAGAEARGAFVIAALVMVAGACGRMKSPDDGTPGVAGSSGAAGGSGGTDAGATSADADVGDTIEIDGGACTAVVAQHPNEGALHVPCVPIPTYGTKPPSSGNHYMIWADYQTYTAPVPWGNTTSCIPRSSTAPSSSSTTVRTDAPTRSRAAQAKIDGLAVPARSAVRTSMSRTASLGAAPHRSAASASLAPDPTLDGPLGGFGLDVDAALVVLRRGDVQRASPRSPLRARRREFFARSCTSRSATCCESTVRSRRQPAEADAAPIDCGGVGRRGAAR